MTTDTARSNEKDIKETRSLTTAASWSGQGRENTRDLLKANPKLAEKLGARCEKTLAAKPVASAADASGGRKRGAGGRLPVSGYHPLAKTRIMKHARNAFLHLSPGIGPGFLFEASLQLLTEGKYAQQVVCRQSGLLCYQWRS